MYDSIITSDLKNQPFDSKRNNECIGLINL